MNGLKKFGLVVCILLFGPLFLLSVFAYSFNRTIGDQEYTKQTIEESGFYSATGEAIIANAVGEAGSDPLIAAALSSAVSGNQLQTALEPLIDGTYGWLNGTTQQPEFKMEIEPIKSTFQQNLTTALQARAASLPPCSRAIPLTGEDVFSYNCIPPGTDVNAVINDAVTRVMVNASIFSDQLVADGSISTEDAQQLGVNDPTRNLPSELPSLYQFLPTGQWFFIISTILSAAGVVLLSRAWLRGVRNLGILLVINGLFVLVIGLVLGFVVSSLIPTTSVDATESTVNALEQASKVILADNAWFLKVLGTTVSVLGIVSIVASTICINKQKTPLVESVAKPETKL